MTEERRTASANELTRSIALRRLSAALSGEYREILAGRLAGIGCPDPGSPGWRLAVRAAEEELAERHRMTLALMIDRLNGQGRSMGRRRHRHEPNRRLSAAG